MDYSNSNFYFQTILSGKIISYIALALYPIISGYRDALTFPVKADIGRRWHWSGAILRGAIILFVCPIKFYIAYILYYWITFDSSYNLNVKQDRKIWYIGTESDMDMFFRFIFLNMPILFYIVRIIAFFVALIIACKT